MSPLRNVHHLLQQGPVVRSLLRAATTRPAKDQDLRDLPATILEETVAPRPRELVEAYLRHVGGDERAWRGELPPHLFSQWGFPLLTRTVAGLPYDLRRGLNAGCSLRIHSAIPVDEPLLLRAQRIAVDDDGRRALLTTRLWTGTRSAPDALESDLRIYVPLKRRSADSSSIKPKIEKPSTPEDARILERWSLAPDAGRTFAALTGDINPIHWLPIAARAAGFRNVILHGFSTFARALETLNRTRFAGDVHRLAAVDVRFTRPIVLPARPAVFLHGTTFTVGPHPGAPCNLLGTFEVNDG